MDPILKQYEKLIEALPSDISEAHKIVVILKAVDALDTDIRAATGRSYTTVQIGKIVERYKEVIRLARKAIRKEPESLTRFFNQTNSVIANEFLRKLLCKALDLGNFDEVSRLDVKLLKELMPILAGTTKPDAQKTDEKPKRKHTKRDKEKAKTALLRLTQMDEKKAG